MGESPALGAPQIDAGQGLVGNNRLVLCISKMGDRDILALRREPGQSKRVTLPHGG